MLTKLYKSDYFKKLDWIVIAILIIATLLRVVCLDLRPPHHDEGINGWFADKVQYFGYYDYDPHNYHGPLHFYLLFLFQALFGRNLWSLRMPTVIVSILCVYWIILFSRFLGRRTCLIAAFAMAISPAYVFFSKYVNFDMFITLFSILCVWGLVGLYKEGEKKYLWSIGIGAAGLLLTKETCILHYGCMILAYICLRIYEKNSPSLENEIAVQKWNKKDLLTVLGVNSLIVIFFYSGGFLHFSDLIDLTKTYTIWLITGTEGSGHEKPFFYWLKFFLIYEQAALLGLIACLRLLNPYSRVLRYIAIYGFGVFLAHSIIAYKTPWLIVGMMWPFYLVFGNFVENFIKTQYRVYVIFSCVTVFIASFFFMMKCAFINYDSEKEPYVYVHTYNSIYKVSDPIFKLVKKDPSNYDLKGHVLRTNYWPLPWLLGDFPNIGYYDYGKGGPSEFDSDFLFVESKRILEVEEDLKQKYFTETLKMRDSQDLSKLYFNYEKFKDIFPNRDPEFIPQSIEIKPGEGLKAKFYRNSKWDGDPAFIKNIQKVDFFWEEDKPLDSPFSILFEGEVYVHSKLVTFILNSDDGAFLEVDGKLIINDLGPHPLNEASGTITVNNPGWKKIRVGFYDIGGGAVIKLRWLNEYGANVIIPKSAFMIGDVMGDRK